MDGSLGVLTTESSCRLVGANNEIVVKVPLQQRVRHPHWITGMEQLRSARLRRRLHFASGLRRRGAAISVNNQRL